MILRMAKVRILGPRERLPAVLRTVQDVGLVHLAGRPATPAVRELPLSPREERLARQLRRVLLDVEGGLRILPHADGLGPSLSPAPCSSADLVRWARLARRTRVEAEALARRATELDEERAFLQRYSRFFAEFGDVLLTERRWVNATAYHIVLRQDGEQVARLRAALAAAVGADFELRARPLPTGETGVLLLLPTAAARVVERIMGDARVEEIRIPEGYGATLGDALPRMLERLDAIGGEAEGVRARLEERAAQHRGELERAASAIHDRLLELEALRSAGVTAHTFVLDGWVPEAAVADVPKRLAAGFGDVVVMEVLSREEWTPEEAPVVLSNPRLFRPFELLVGLMPLPRYGTIDPTPFMAVFFPMFFGLILGDVGYGALLALLALVLVRRTEADAPLRAVGEIAGACALFSILFGLGFGELFGDLGRRFLGLKPLVMDREAKLLPFLGLAVSIGLVHVLLGLILGVVAEAREAPRKALGRGVSALLILLILAAILAAVEVLPKAFFTPAVVVLLVTFPVLVFAEGIIAPVELLATVGNVLSYARIAALGTASVMMAVVANRMVGAIGSVAVGLLFALLFHLVNFALGLFSPTIHALRLHYVEFFGKFFSPGGTRYRPFRHWSAPGGSTPWKRESAWISSGSR
ncbi:MAG TPA: V-type ATPase 116kDa subunit family protein [Longimicrobiales bacterium]|nr:V-type ATPase 116kDa subunit family protein [Longimicrobiales bacterium]